MAHEGGLNWDELSGAVAKARTFDLVGRVEQVIGLTLEARGPAVELGELCRISGRGARGPILGEVVGFRGDRVLIMPLDELDGVGPGAKVVAEGRPLTVGAGDGLLGRVVDGLGRPIDGRGPVGAVEWRQVHNAPPHPLKRRRINQPLPVGVRAVDGLLTCGKGQRMGIFSGSGVGKSTLLGMIARNTSADVNVIALVGERGREVRDFLEKDLGPEGLSRSVVVVATSDRPALVRVKAAFVATSIAEHFRDQGKDVLLMMDSVTRFAMAQREIGLATGEPPATRGYTPSVFALLPRLLERAGNAGYGSITGFYTVLVDGDDFTEPVTDAARGILDGHLVLTRELAAQTHYPAIDVLGSVSRLMNEVVTPEHLAAAAQVKSIIASYREAVDLVNIGAYARGSNPKVDRALLLIDAINGFLRQGISERFTFERTVGELSAILAPAAGLLAAGA